MIRNKIKILLGFFRDKRKKSFLKILKEFFSLWMFKKELPIYYFKYIYRKSILNYKDYLSTNEIRKIVFNNLYHKEELLNIISNKLSFSLYLKKNNLPTPKLISYNLNSNFFYNNTFFSVKCIDDLIVFFDHIFEKSNQKNVFIKPLSSYGGKGCYKINKDNLKEDIQNCGGFIINNDCIHEEVIVQHPKINKIHSKSINTLRIITYIDTKGKIHIPSMFMRFGINDSFVDNAAAGGLFIGVNMEKGTLMQTAHQEIQFGGKELESHPNSNYTFENFEIPYFIEACELAIKAVTYLPDRFIGWDIAISEESPIIIEANEHPDLLLSDIACGGSLKIPLFKKIVKEVL